MIRSGFGSSRNRKEMHGCVKSQAEAHGIARRANALLLLDDGQSCAQIAKVLYLDDDAARLWHKQYLQGGWDLVVINDWQGGQSRMSADQEAALCGWLEGRFYRKTTKVRAYVRTDFDIPYS